MREGTMKCVVVALACCGPIFGSSPASAADIQLRIGDLTVATTAITSASCLQVPIFLRDPDAPRSLRSLGFTVELSGDVGVIAGGAATEMLVVNAFTGGSLVGIADPGVNLINNSSGTGPFVSLGLQPGDRGFRTGDELHGWSAERQLGRG